MKRLISRICVTFLAFVLGLTASEIWPLLWSATQVVETAKGQVVETAKVHGIICSNWREWKEWFREAEFWTPSKEQILEAEREIENHLKERPDPRSAQLWEKLSQYQRQYVGLIINGRKMIFCNYFCFNWQRESLTCSPVFVCDGGDCYFQIEYDVEGRKVDQITINGDA